MVAGTDSVIASSLESKLQGLANEVLPESSKVAIHGKQLEPHPGKKS